MVQGHLNEVRRAHPKSNKKPHRNKKNHKKRHQEIQLNSQRNPNKFTEKIKKITEKSQTIGCRGIQMSCAELIPSPLSSSEDNCWQNIFPHSRTMPMESQTRLFLTTIHCGKSKMSSGTGSSASLRKSKTLYLSNWWKTLTKNWEHPN